MNLGNWQRGGDSTAPRPDPFPRPGDEPVTNGRPALTAEQQARLRAHTQRRQED